MNLLIHLTKLLAICSYVISDVIQRSELEDIKLFRGDLLGFEFSEYLSKKEQQKNQNFSLKINSTCSQGLCVKHPGDGRPILYIDTNKILGDEISVSAFYISNTAENEFHFYFKIYVVSENGDSRNFEIFEQDKTLIKIFSGSEEILPFNFKSIYGANKTVSLEFGDEEAGKFIEYKIQPKYVKTRILVNYLAIDLMFQWSQRIGESHFIVYYTDVDDSSKGYIKLFYTNHKEYTHISTIEVGPIKKDYHYSIFKSDKVRIIVGFEGEKSSILVLAELDEIDQQDEVELTRTDIGFVVTDFYVKVMNPDSKFQTVKYLLYGIRRVETCIDGQSFSPCKNYFFVSQLVFKPFKLLKFEIVKDLSSLQGNFEKDMKIESINFIDCSSFHMSIYSEVIIYCQVISSYYQITELYKVIASTRPGFSVKKISLGSDRTSADINFVCSFYNSDYETFTNFYHEKGKGIFAKTHDDERIEFVSFRGKKEYSLVDSFCDGKNFVYFSIYDNSTLNYSCYVLSVNGVFGADKRLWGVIEFNRDQEKLPKMFEEMSVFYNSRTDKVDHIYIYFTFSNSGKIVFESLIFKINFKYPEIKIKARKPGISTKLRVFNSPKNRENYFECNLTVFDFKQTQVLDARDEEEQEKGILIIPNTTINLEDYIELEGPVQSVSLKGHDKFRLVPRITRGSSNSEIKSRFMNMVISNEAIFGQVKSGILFYDIISQTELLVKIFHRIIDINFCLVNKNRVYYFALVATHSSNQKSIFVFKKSNLLIGGRAYYKNTQKLDISGILIKNMGYEDYRLFIKGNLRYGSKRFDGMSRTKGIIYWIYNQERIIILQLKFENFRRKIEKFNIIFISQINKHEIFKQDYDINNAEIAIHENTDPKFKFISLFLSLENIIIHRVIEYSKGITIFRHKYLNYDNRIPDLVTKILCRGSEISELDTNKYNIGVTCYILSKHKMYVPSAMIKFEVERKVDEKKWVELRIGEASISAIDYYYVPYPATKLNLYLGDGFMTLQIKSRRSGLQELLVYKDYSGYVHSSIILPSGSRAAVYMNRYDQQITSLTKKEGSFLAISCSNGEFFLHQLHQFAKIEVQDFEIYKKEVQEVNIFVHPHQKNRILKKIKFEFFHIQFDWRETVIVLILKFTQYFALLGFTYFIWNLLRIYFFPLFGIHKESYFRPPRNVIIDNNFF